MYKCTSKKCNFTIKDAVLTAPESSAVSRSYKIANRICPYCDEKIVYVNELQLKIDKYKKSMK